jgi:hypothetical protein
MGIMVRKIQNDIEAMRKELLVPLETQESEVLGSIDRSYLQLHYANSIVTGHLSSVAKVHQTQAELLKAIGVERDLRKEMGRNIAKASDEIADLVEAAESIEDNVNNAEKFAKDLKDTIDGLAGKLKKRPEEG